MDERLNSHTSFTACIYILSSSPLPRRYTFHLGGCIFYFHHTCTTLFIDYTIPVIDNPFHARKEGIQFLNNLDAFFIFNHITHNTFIYYQCRYCEVLKKRSSSIRNAFLYIYVSSYIEYIII